MNVGAKKCYNYNLFLDSIYIYIMVYILFLWELIEVLLRLGTIY